MLEAVPETVAFTPLFWAWIAGLVLVFLPLELFAAAATPGKTDTFSEFIWWAFGIRPRRDGTRVRWALARRVVLGLMCVSLSLHFVLGMSYVPVAIFGAAAGTIMLYAVLFERKGVDSGRGA